MTSSLATARDSVAGGDLVAALEAMLEAWHTSRDPALGALVAILSDRILAARKNDGKGIRDPEAWVAAAKDPPADLVGRLAPTLFAAKQIEAKRRFESMQEWGPDPRVSRALEDGLLRPPWVGKGMRAEWGIVFAQCVRHADAALVATLEKLAAEQYLRGTAVATNEWMTAQCGEAAREGRAVLARMTACDPAARDALAREIAATERGHARGERSEQELLDVIWADPESDEKRLVYGDFLLERSDPRGELFALQFKENATREDRARIDVLRAKHLRALLGPLHGGVEPETAVIERGFLVRGTILIRLKKDVARLHGHPAWGTVRELSPPTEGQAVEPSFYGTGVLRDLRTITGLDAASGRALLSTPPPKLAMLGAALGAAAASLDAVASLRRLYLTIGITTRWRTVEPELRDVLKSRRARALDWLALGLFAGIDEWLPFFLENDPGCGELVRGPTGVADPERDGEWFVLRRDAHGRRSVLEITLRGESTNVLTREKNVDHVYRIIAAQLERLDPGILTEIAVVSSRPGTAARAALEAAANRQPLTRLDLPATRL